MNASKKTIFRAAHDTAKRTVKLVGDYKVAFTYALKEIYSLIKNNPENPWSKVNAFFLDAVGVSRDGCYNSKKYPGRELYIGKSVEHCENFIATSRKTLNTGKIWDNKDGTFRFYVYK